MSLHSAGIWCLISAKSTSESMKFDDSLKPPWIQSDDSWHQDFFNLQNVQSWKETFNWPGYGRTWRIQKTEKTSWSVLPNLPSCQKSTQSLEAKICSFRRIDPKSWITTSGPIHFLVFGLFRPGILPSCIQVLERLHWQQLWQTFWVLETPFATIIHLQKKPI